MTPTPSRLTLAAVVAAALGACALASSAMDPLNGVPPWTLAAGGAALLVVSLVVLWRAQRRRDRSLW
jgi:membrane protein implicated in regulation of membrane protease activity